METSEDPYINDKLEQENDKLLLELATVYNFIKENELTRVLTNRTMNDYIQSAIDEIKGPTITGRPSKLQRLDLIEAALNDIVSALK